MKVTQIEYSALFNTGNYENEKIGLTVSLEEGETVEETVVALRKKTAEMVGPKAMEQVNLKHRLNQAVREMQQKAETAKVEYERMAEFLKAQGIKGDMADFPLLKILLPGKDEQPQLPEPATEFTRVRHPLGFDPDVDAENEEDEDPEF